MLHKRLLQRSEFPVFRQSLYGPDGAPFRSSVALITKPGEQKPHWMAPCSTKDSCSGVSFPSSDNPSMVRMVLPSASTAKTRQARTASPSIITVHAPHAPVSQPRLVPVKVTFSRKASSKVVLGAQAMS